MSTIAIEFLWVVLVSLIVAATVAFTAKRLAPRAAWPLAVALGYVAGHFSLLASAGFARAIASMIRPTEARDWVPTAVLLALGVTIVGLAAPRAARPWILCLAALLSIATPLRLLAASVHVAQNWSAGEKLAHLALLAASLGLTWLLLAAPRAAEQPGLRAFLMVLVAVGTAIVIALAGSIRFGMLACAVAAALMGTAGCHWLCQWFDATPTTLAKPVAPTEPKAWHNIGGLSGAAGVVTFSLGSLILLGHFYAELTATNAALLVLSLIAAGGPLPAVVSTGSAWRPTVVRAALSLAPLAFAVFASLA